MTRSIRFLAVLAVLALLAAACGQKPGVHQGGRDVGLAPSTAEFDGEVDELDGEFGEWDDELGDLAGDPEGDLAGLDEDLDTGDGMPAANGASSGAGGAPAGTQTQQQRGGGQQEQQRGGEQQQQRGGEQQQRGAGDQPEQEQRGGEQQRSADPDDTRGVTESTIKIGVHAPLSGAAPLPQSEFQSGQRQYWDHVGQVAGRDVEVIVRDDQYNPSRATSVCNELIQRQEVFLLVGGGGVDQIVACARVAAQQRVPYLSAGVDEGVLRQLPNYFALSMSYVQQAPLVAQYVERHAAPSDRRVALVRDRTPGFNNVVQRLDEELKRRGFETQQIQFQNGPSTAQAVSGFETAFAIMAPSDFVQIVRSPGGDNPKWVGVGITMGLNTVASAACSGTSYEAMFLSPFPGLNVIDDLDPDFRRAGGQGDIELALWGLNKSLHEVFKLLGDDITRSGFVNALVTNRIATNVYPELRHTPDDRFGAQSAHVLEANCSNNRYETPQGGTFVQGF